MSAPRPVPPHGEASWLDWAANWCVSSDELEQHVKAELAELRKERDELREAVLALGVGAVWKPWEWTHNTTEVIMRLTRDAYMTWFVLVTKLRAETTKETEP